MSVTVSVSSEKAVSGDVPYNIIVGLLLGLLAWPSLAEVAQGDAARRVSFGFVVNTRYDDNIGLAPDSDSERNDFTTTVAGQAVWTAQESAVQDLAFTFSPFYAGVADLGDLSHYGAGLSIAFDRRFSANFTAPYVSFDLGGRWLQFEDSEPRDGYDAEAQLGVGKRFGPKFGAELGYRYELRRSTNSNPEGRILQANPTPPGGFTDRNSDKVFDLDRHGPYVSLQFEPAFKLSAFLEYNFMMGDVAATGDALGFNDPARFDSVRDFAFEEGRDFLAWRIDADQHIYSAGGSYSVANNIGLDAAVSYLDAKGQSDNNYSNLVATLGLSWMF